MKSKQANSRIKIMRVALTFHINVGLIISRYEAEVTINEIYASWTEFVEDWPHVYLFMENDYDNIIRFASLKNVFSGVSNVRIPASTET